MTECAGPSRYRWVVLGVALVAFMQTHLHRMAFPPLIPSLVADLGLSYAVAGTIQTAYFWTYTLAQMPIGVATDRWGARPMMGASMAVLAVGAVAFALAGGAATAVVARMVVGLGAAAVWVPGMRLAMDWFPAPERGRMAGLLSTGGALGAVAGFVVVPWVATYAGWRLAYGVLAAPALATVVLVALLVRGGPGGDALAAGTLRGLGRVLATPAVWPVNVAVLFAFGGYISFMTFLPAFLVKDLGLSETRAGLVAALVTGGLTLSYPLAGILSDRLGRRKWVYLASQLASVVFCAVFAVVVPRFGTPAAWTAALVGGILQGGMILPFVLVMELFPAGLAATASSVANTACFVGAMVLPIVLGRVVDVTGSFAAAFGIAAAAQLVALASGLFIRESAPAGSAARALA